MKKQKASILIVIVASLTIVAITAVLMINIVNKKKGTDDTAKLETENQDTNSPLKEEHDDEHKESQVDWSNLEVAMNGILYKYPFKLSDFINNGWNAVSADFEKILNDTVNTSISQTYTYIRIK